MTDTFEIQITKNIQKIYFRANPSLSLNKMIPKNTIIGQYSINNPSLSKTIKSKKSGKITFINKSKESPTTLIFTKPQQNNQIEFLDQHSEDSILLYLIEECPHSVIFHQTCSECFEKIENSNKHLLFDKISSIQVKGKMVEKKMEDLKKKKKLIMILDLDNTVIHAFQCDKEFMKKEKENKKIFFLDFGHGNYYALKLRPFLNFYLESLKDFFEIFVYTFGTRDYAELILDIIDPKEIFLKVF